MEKMNENIDISNKRQIHLVIGITGHRDIFKEDKEELKNKIKGVFKELKEKFPETPLLLLTPLAEGADRIAAEAAIEENVNYVVVLPMPEDLYKKDFPDTVKEYEELKTHSLGSFELPIKEEEKKLIEDYGPERDKRYEEVGVYIVVHSQILIALWDGKDTGLKGGTSQIVKFKLGEEEIPREYLKNLGILEDHDRGPVVHIPTRRAKDKDSQIDKEVKWKYPKDMKEDDFFGKKGIFTKINEFNKEIKKLDVNKINRSRNTLISDKNQSQVESILNKEKFVSYIFAEADALSMGYRDNWKLMQIFLLFLLPGVLLVLLLLYDFSDTLIVLVLYSVLYIILILMFKYWNLSRNFHNKYIEFRTLAEGLRVLFFLRLAGLHEDIEDLYAKKHKSKFRWIREVLRSANVFDPQPPSNVDENSYEIIEKYWIQGQHKYFTEKAEKNKKIVKKVSITSSVILFVGIGVIILLIILKMVHGIEIFLPIIMIITYYILVFFAGAVDEYLKRFLYLETKEEYDRIKGIFEKAMKRWNNASLNEKSKILIELAKEAMRENGDWFLLNIYTSDDVLVP